MKDFIVRKYHTNGHYDSYIKAEDYQDAYNLALRSGDTNFTILAPENVEENSSKIWA